MGVEVKAGDGEGVVEVDLVVQVDDEIFGVLLNDLVVALPEDELGGSARQSH